MHCSTLVERDAHFCPQCGSRSPFGYQCPACLKPIERGNAVCASCGRQLTTLCPYCGGSTFVGAQNCDACGKTLLIRCESKRCGELQFFENPKCTVCGKRIKKAKKQIENIRKGGK
jgi:RNA polymerase subunit RPABC4/transcription elongation factor Spt4